MDNRANMMVKSIMALEATRLSAHGKPHRHLVPPRQRSGKSRWKKLRRVRG